MENPLRQCCVTALGKEAMRVQRLLCKVSWYELESQRAVYKMKVESALLAGHIGYNQAGTLLRLSTSLPRT